ncbi:FAD dependent oxidoreductase [Prosthecobacter fusiformis]|uniref:FAD dependent oxidoreductase n=1 Tax=Prosthecobacter fusiformis TaxID=48464 RepID=A0A4R7RLF5_9BACT|nr:FAD-dependent oxidoreductase [Prosthecobacter fusiformis]TDU64596.1 FAD dependent oxidoreductase [Prosthecobacter fusiformis]
MKHLLVSLFLNMTLWFLPASTIHAAEPPAATYDLIVIEATPGGIATAVRAAREGLNVLLVNRTQHLGGIVANGLGVWDTLYEGRRSPIYDEVRRSIIEHYRLTYGEGSSQHIAALPGKSGHTNGRFEPSIAEKFLTELVVREKNITLLKGYVPASVMREDRMIQGITFQQFQGRETRTFVARFFADCTYEGDLLPLTGVTYRVGRESRAEFNEHHAGKIYLRPVKDAPTPEAASMAAMHDRLNLRKFPGFQEIVSPASTGEGDLNVQAFNYRTILTSNPSNRLPVEKPADYDPEFLSTLEFGSIVSPLPNKKIGWNRPQLVGPHQAYVEGDWPTRLKVMEQHWQATMGLLYYLQNDPAVPEERRRFFSTYGLAKDEFADNAHRPHEFYVREARRLTGRHIISQHDFTPVKGTSRTPIQHDSIAFADWYMDAHACTLGKSQGSLDEGKMMLHAETFPAQIPYRALLSPDLDNLLVPVCLSSTHVAWGAIRLEPTWMQVGESAGYACALAKNTGTTPASLDSARLVRTLSANHSMITFFNDVDISLDDPSIVAAQVFSTQGFFHDYDARLDHPLKTATAKVWLQTLQSRVSGPDAVQKTAAAVASAEAGYSSAITPEAWHEMLVLLGHKTAPVPAGSEITRGRALRDLNSAGQ